MRNFIRLLTGRINYERKARLLAAQLGHESAAQRRAQGYVACDSIEEAELWLDFLLGYNV